jgi:hypothetical protein
MSHRQKLEQVLELLINEEQDAAADLLHSVIVEKARTMYEDLVDEDFGGDEKEDFASDIEADKEEIESDEIFDGEDEEGEEGISDEPAEEEEVEDRLEDVEASLAELRAEFDSLLGDEEGVEAELGGEEEFGSEEGFGDEAGFGGEEELEVESMYEEEEDEDLDEATKLQDEVSGNPLDSEGKLSGTGKNSKSGATNKKSLFTKAPSKADHGGKPHETGKGGDESTKKVGEGEDNTPTSNVDVKQGKESASNDAKDDKGAKSPLGSSGSPKGN